jgi:glucose-6-phosphate isomerase
MQEKFKNNTHFTTTTNTQVQLNLKQNKYLFFNSINDTGYTTIQNLTNKIQQSFKKTIIIGCGGSINAGITYSSLYENNLLFIDNIDPETIHQITQNIRNYIDYYFIFISKSGKSEEVLLLYDIFKKKFIAQQLNPIHNFLIITQANNNPLHTIALQNNYHFLEHAANIGGRFSYLSINSLLIASLANCNLTKIHQGANQAICDYLNNPQEKNNFCKTLATKMLNHTLHTNVNMIYNDKLLNYNVWLQQLWAESLGKNNLGSVMVGFSGTRDQHSQLQLYLASPAGKAFNIITCENFNSEFTQLTFAYNKHAKSVLTNLAKTGAIIKQQQLKQLDEYTLAYIMTYSIIEVLLCSEYMAINPFSQDQVEAIKLANNINA